MLSQQLLASVQRITEHMLPAQQGLGPVTCGSWKTSGRRKHLQDLFVAVNKVVPYSR